MILTYRMKTLPEKKSQTTGAWALPARLRIYVIKIPDNWHMGPTCKIKNLPVKKSQTTGAWDLPAGLRLYL